MKFTALAVLSLFAFTGLISAQEKVPPKKLRFIALGELPVWKEEIIDGIRVGKEPPKGSVPPGEISIVSGENIIPFRLGLRSLTSPVTVDGNAASVVLRNGPTPEASRWVTKPMPQGPYGLGVLFRKPNGGLWDSPAMMMLEDDAANFPQNHIRFVNTSTKVVVFQLQNPKSRKKTGALALKPGDSIVKPLKLGANSINVGYQLTGGRLKSIWKNQIKIMGNQRVQCFFYDSRQADGKGGVRFFYSPEPTPNR